MNTGVHLLTYTDRLTGNLQNLHALLSNELDCFTGVHILPFFTPYDGDDTGFDPIDHSTVDPRLGNWDDVQAIADDGLSITADIIVNHMSSESPQFREWLDTRAHDGLFLTFDTVFPHGATGNMITKFYRPRPGLPFTAFRHADGSRELVWTTFMPSQVDIDVQHAEGWQYLTSLLKQFAQSGVSTVRIDAVGYAIKTPGTDSFMTADTLNFVRTLTKTCHQYGLKVLVEVHAHYAQQQAIAPLVDYVYDFATPALLLDALGTGRSSKFADWLRQRPVNTITVLDTHDGIGIIDAGPGPDGEPGFLTQQDMADIFDRAKLATHGLSAQASVIPQWFTLPHQINATFYSVLGCDDLKYLIARAVQFFLPGIPQVYYVGLLAGTDDQAEYERTGEGRNVNRHRYVQTEIQQALQQPVVRALMNLIRLRSSHPAFDDESIFTYEIPSDSKLRLTRTYEHATAQLEVDFAIPSMQIMFSDGHRTQIFTDMNDLIHAQIVDDHQCCENTPDARRQS